MEKIMGILERYFLPVAAKIGTQKHLIALRDAFIATMPITMAGATAVLLNVFFRDLPNEFGWTGVVETLQPLISINGIIWTGSIAVMAVMFAIAFGYNLSKAYGIEPLSGSLVSVSAFLLGLTQVATTTLNMVGEFLPQEAAQILTGAGATIVDGALNEFGEIVDGTRVMAGGWGYFQFFKHMSSGGLFTAMIICFIATMIYCKLMAMKITIKLPDSVPPAVSKAFEAIIPAGVALYVCAIINFLFTQVTGEAMIDWITMTIQEPLLQLSQGFGAVLLTVFFIHFLWFFGLHGNNILLPIMETVYKPALLANIDAFQLGVDIPNNWNLGSFNAFVWPGGAGGTLVLITGIFLFSRRAESKAVAKLSLGPGIFNINEPVMFGMPIVLNPIYMIPFILGPVLTTTIAYYATVLGFVRPVVIEVSWVVPTIINGFLATGLDWRSIILSVVNITVLFIVWIPFIMMANRVESE